MPPSLQDYTITFIDLDLDVHFWPDGTREILDVNEFDAQRVQYPYPDWVQTNAREAWRKDIIVMAATGQGQFRTLVQS